MAETSQDSFHSMRGHVEVGTVVHMNNGDTLTLFNRINGWVFVDQHNRDVHVPTDSAQFLERVVYSYPTSRQAD